MEYIRKQSLLADLNETTPHSYFAFETMVRVYPTEDVAPVVHAKWTRKRTQMHDGELYCSNCEWSPEVLGGTTLGDLQLADVYYCPHCGAKMDEAAVFLKNRAEEIDTAITDY